MTDDHRSLASAAACAIAPPVEPILAKPADSVPEAESLYEPKWDGFRALVFRAGDTTQQRLERRTGAGSPGS